MATRAKKQDAAPELPAAETPETPAAETPPAPEYASQDHEHAYALADHEHTAVPDHEHEAAHAAGPHRHDDLRGELRGAVRALLKVFEAGKLNSDQMRALHAVRVVIGDAHGLGCAHEAVAYEAGDVLVCQNPDCRAVIEDPDRAPRPAAPTG